MNQAISAPIVPAARGKSSPFSLPPSGLWEAVRRVCFSRGYISHLAEELEVDKRDLYRWSTNPSNRSDEHRDMPAAMIVPLTIATDDLTILKYLADACGCVVTKRPAAAETASPLLARLAAITAEFADVQRLGAEALGDEQVSGDEARAITMQITELQEAAEALRLAVAHLATAPRRPGAKASGR